MTRADGTDGFNEEMGWLPGYEGGDVAGDGFDTAFYAEAASAREYAQRYGEDGQAQRESALKQLEGTGYEELVMQGLQAEQNSAYREKAAAFLESFMKGECIPDVQLGELWQSAQAWKLQRTQAENRQDAAGQTAVANTAREGLNPGSGTAYNESTPNAAEGLTVGESLTEGNGYPSAGEMLGEWAEGAGGTDNSVDDIIKRVENRDIKLSNNMQKGNYGEMKMDSYFKQQGYERISLDKVTDINASTHRGIDGVYYKPGRHPLYVIGEAKYGSSQLGKTLDGKQMNDSWITGSNRLENAVGKDLADDILLEGYDKTWVRVNPDGTVVPKGLK